MKKTVIGIEVAPEHLAVILAAVTETGIAAGITLNGRDSALTDRTMVPMDRDDEEALETVSNRRTVRRQRASTTRVAYRANIGDKRGQHSRAEIKKADLSPARRKVLDFVIAAGAAGVTGGFAEISKATRLNPKTVDGSIYWLRHNRYVVSTEQN